MSTEPTRSPGSFRALGERLLRESFPSKDDAAVVAYLERALVRVRRAAGTQPLPTLTDIRTGAFTPGALASADLSGADLSGANLSGANLSGADLSRADLSGVDFSGAKLSGAGLSGANLSRADLRGAKLGAARLNRANLSGVDLRGADLRLTYLLEANVVRARWDRETVWPWELEAWILDHSEAVSSGGYQVQGGAAGTDHDLLVPIGF